MAIIHDQTMKTKKKFNDLILLKISTSHSFIHRCSTSEEKKFIFHTFYIHPDDNCIFSFPDFLYIMGAKRKFFNSQTLLSIGNMWKSLKSKNHHHNQHVDSMIILLDA